MPPHTHCPTDTHAHRYIHTQTHTHTHTHARTLNHKTLFPAVIEMVGVEYRMFVTCLLFTCKSIGGMLLACLSYSFKGHDIYIYTSLILVNSFNFLLVVLLVLRSMYQTIVGCLCVLFAILF